MLALYETVAEPLVAESARRGRGGRLHHLHLLLDRALLPRRRPAGPARELSPQHAHRLDRAGHERDAARARAEPRRRGRRARRRRPARRRCSPTPRRGDSAGADARRAAAPSQPRPPAPAPAPTDSTNDRARELALAGAPHGTLVTAAEQTAGRGRQGRRWSAPADSALLMSLVLREPPPLLPLIAAVAVCDVAGEQARIKWPNDIVLARGRRAWRSSPGSSPRGARRRAGRCWASA